MLEFEALFGVKPRKVKPNVVSADLNLNKGRVRGICEISSMVKKVWMDGKKVWEQTSPQYPGREPKDKPAFHPSMLKPKMARLLVNLARVKRGGKLMDPFCGTGSILIEANYLDIKSVGMDLDWKAIQKSKINLKHYKIPAKVEVGDATKLEEKFKPNSIDGIATDLPYGRSSTLGGRKIAKLYYDFLSSSLKVLKKDGYLVMMKPSKVRNRIPKGFKKVGQGDFYAHSGLTRRVVILRK